MFLGICTAVSSSMANSVKFSAIFLLAEARPQGFSANGGRRANWMRASPLARSSVLFDINIACARPGGGGGGGGYCHIWAI